MNEPDIPAAWEDSARQILDGGWRRVLVIGATDLGKSTYCGFLVRRLGAVAPRIAFVDADVGQKDIGPPATITLAYPDVAGDLGHTPVAGLYFVGATSPAAHFLHMVVGTTRMVEAAQAPRVIIDTTGLIHGGGQLLKAHKIEAVRPDVIVALERGQELEPIVRAQRHRNVIRLQPSPAATPKPGGQRRRARALAFRRHFADARELVLDIPALVFQRSPIFNGERLAAPHHVYAERTPEGITVVGPQESAVPEGVRVIPAGFEQGLLCALADTHGTVLGLGIIRKIDFRRGTIALLAPVAAQHIRVLQLGDLYLSPDGTELARRTVVGPRPHHATRKTHHRLRPPGKPWHNRK